MVDFIDKQQDDAFGSYHVFLDFVVKVSVTVRIKQVQHFFLRHYLAFLVENFEVVLIQQVVYLVNLGFVESHMRLDDAKCAVVKNSTSCDFFREKDVSIVSRPHRW